MKVDSRSPAVVGRQARLELDFGCRNGRTVLTHGYAEPPLRIGPTFELDAAIYVILVCTGPGVFAGDSLHQRISVASGARAVVVSQSALQIHPSRDSSPAIVRHEYQVEEDGELHCHWDPVVPFKRARLAQSFDLRLAAGSRVYWSDGLMSGRVGRGECWQFDFIDHELRLVAGGALQYLERCRIVPGEGRQRCRWIAGDGDYMGTAIVYHEASSVDTAEQLHRDLARVERLTAAVDLADTRLIVGRFLTADGVAFARGRTLFRQRVLDAVFDSPELVGRR
ncbi:MAG TPA: urease accessory protein UreD [Vicinamibacterales bacterium]|nr:urease accessory protein UreD [Vicinamibacterales bacterium]